MKLAIIGSALAGGAVQIIDILQEDDLAQFIRVYDDAEEAQGRDVLGVPIVGTVERLIADFRDKIVDSAIIAVGSVSPRKALFEKVLTAGFMLPNIVSRKSIISASASMGVGNVVLPLAYVGPRVKLGNNNYLTTASVINHDSILGSHCYFSTGVSVAGRVTIGDQVRLDTSASVTADAVLPDCSLVGPGQSFGPVRGR